ncbi:beta-mannanase [Paenibacillus rhizophilus]|uniref:Beta-mannanase n=1 Tax=Paenibacillus rhizophilus TaxID=1850366 RepID=A0A3N9P422_9BACL|nr:beta-mannanase [Paenibacillus rhizophilus]RQW09824.1 beta-mannanase [Paenibacillus rhizophilus]
MRYIELSPDLPVITDMTSRVEDRLCTLRWRWPDGLQAVYVHKGPEVGTYPEDDSHLPGGLKLYTREEYKANGGYHDRLEDIGPVVYTVFARLTENGEALLVRQRDGFNRASVSAGKALIYYAINTKRGLFRKEQTVHMTITAEVPVGRDVLCYVKKHGGYPAAKEDGILFPFVQDFAPGRNALPPIEIGKDDRIRIFFTDGPKYGRYYELVPE